MQHDAEPQESQDGELVVHMVRNHGNAPSHWCDRMHFTRFGGQWNYPHDRGTRPYHEAYDCSTHKELVLTACALLHGGAAAVALAAQYAEKRSRALWVARQARQGGGRSGHGTRP